MLALHPQILEKNGKKEFVILPYEEYSALASELEEYEDLKELRDAKNAEKDAVTLSLKQVREELGI